MAEDSPTANIAATRLATGEEWDRAFAADPDATYFQSRAWARVWSRASRDEIRPKPLWVDFADGTSAVVPVSIAVSMRVVRRALIAPAGTYGTWLRGDATFGVEHETALIAHVCAAYPALEWRIGPFGTLTEDHSGEDVREDTTQVIEFDRPLEEIERGWSRSHRDAIRRAPKRGVQVRVATSIEDWHEYDHVYRDSLGRWGDRATSRYDATLFEALAECAPDVQLWVAERDGTIVAGAICCYTPAHVAYWHGATLEQHFDARPLHAVLAAAIRDAHQRGARWFDFNPSGGHAGTRTFKQRFGARELPAPVIARRADCRSAVKDLARRIVAPD